MARALGMNPRKLGTLDNHRQEPWKAPLPVFIENIYFKRFRPRQRPPLERSLIPSETTHSRSRFDDRRAHAGKPSLLNADKRVGRESPDRIATAGWSSA
jgi:hypothetical protein